MTNILFTKLQEAVEHAQATGHVNFQEYRWQNSKQTMKHNLFGGEIVVLIKT